MHLSGRVSVAALDPSRARHLRGQSQSTPASNTVRLARVIWARTSGLTSCVAVWASALFLLKLEYALKVARKVACGGLGSGAVLPVVSVQVVLVGGPFEGLPSAGAGQDAISCSKRAAASSAMVPFFKTKVNLSRKVKILRCENAKKSAKLDAKRGVWRAKTRREKGGLRARRSLRPKSRPHNSVETDENYDERQHF